jgi:dTDP-4-amino-4,6-dideoxygalactose transaminase
VERLKKVCRERDIFVVEDAAQAMVVRNEDRLLGTLGDVGFYSLGRGKNITSGSGGIVITDSDLIGKGIEPIFKSVEKEPFLEKYLNFISVKMIYFFMRPYLYWLPSGLPFLGLGETKFYVDFPIYRFDSTRAGFLNNWREKLETQNRERVIKGRYLHNRMSRLKNVVTFGNVGTSDVPYLRYPLLVETREVKETLCSKAKEMGLGISPMYPKSINRVKELQNLIEECVCPAGEDVVDRLVTLPTHSLLGINDLDAHCNLVEHICGDAGGG